MVYLHAGLEIGSAVPYAIHWESNRGLTCTWLPRISISLGVVMIQTGSTNAKMAKLAVSGDDPGWKMLAILPRQALIHHP